MFGDIYTRGAWSVDNMMRPNNMVKSLPLVAGTPKALRAFVAPYRGRFSTNGRMGQFAGVQFTADSNRIQKCVDVRYEVPYLTFGSKYFPLSNDRKWPN